MIERTEPTGRGAFWWGQATDEPAREDVRSTEYANCATTNPQVFGCSGTL